MRGRNFTTGLALAALVFTFAVVAGCSNNDETTGPGTGTVTLRMTDAPAAIDAVNLVITQVSVNQSSSDAESGWEVLRTDTMDVDLLTLQNGVFTTLATGRVASGPYQQVRLKLGTGSTVVVDGVTHPLTVPSGMQSGLKIVGPFNVPSGGVVDVALDFDAARSIFQTGNGTWMLKPVVHVLPMTQAGSIKGHVLPETASTSVFAMQATDTLGTAVTGVDGRFMISVLPAGTYSLHFDAPAAYRDSTIAGVNVTAGHTTDVGDVTLTPIPTP